jgi:hypothetical protein
MPWLFPEECPGASLLTEFANDGEAMLLYDMDVDGLGNP